MEVVTDDLPGTEPEPGIDKETSAYLIETSNWARFISIACFSYAGLFIMFILYFGKELMKLLTAFGSFGDMLSDRFALRIFVLVFCLIVFATVYYFLVNFANKMKAGVETENIDLVNRGLSSLKIHLVIIGTLLILDLLYTFYKMT